MTVRQETTYPDEAATRLDAHAARSRSSWRCSIRHPCWAAEGIESASTAQKPAGRASKPGELRGVTRTWKTGDTVEIAHAVHAADRGLPRQSATLRLPATARWSCCAEVDAGKPLPGDRRRREPTVIAALTAGRRQAVDLHRLGRCLPRRRRQGAGQPGVDAGAVLPGCTATALRRLLGRLHAATSGRRKKQAYRGRAGPAEGPRSPHRRRGQSRRGPERARPRLQGEKTGAGDFGDRKWRHAPTAAGSPTS